jgi:hypothetical protein
LSQTDPYAAPEDPGAPDVYYPPVAKLEAVAAEPVAEPVTEDPAKPDTEEAVPEGTIAEVMAWVGEDHDRAVRALAAEEAGHNRKSLVKSLSAL